MLVAESGVGTIAAGVAKAKADLIVISGAEGGTGASPASSMRFAGISPEIGLSETQQTLVKNGLRGQVRLQVDGQLKSGRDIILMAFPSLPGRRGWRMSSMDRGLMHRNPTTGLRALPHESHRSQR